MSSCSSAWSAATPRLLWSRRACARLPPGSGRGGRRGGAGDGTQVRGRTGMAERGVGRRPQSESRAVYAWGVPSSRYVSSGNFAFNCAGNFPGFAPE